jgi:hypothetical protein
MPKDVFFCNGYGRKPMYSRWNYSGIKPCYWDTATSVYGRHIVFSDIGCCQPCQIACSCPWVNPKHPYCVLEFLKYVIRRQKNLTNETCYISAHFQFESTISGRHIGKIVEDIRKSFLHLVANGVLGKVTKARRFNSHRSEVTRVKVAWGWFYAPPPQLAMEGLTKRPRVSSKKISWCNPELDAGRVDPRVGSGWVGSDPDFCKFRRVGSGQEIWMFLFTSSANCEILQGLKNCNGIQLTQ